MSKRIERLAERLHERAARKGRSPVPPETIGQRLVEMVREALVGLSFILLGFLLHALIENTPVGHRIDGLGYQLLSGETAESVQPRVTVVDLGVNGNAGNAIAIADAVSRQGPVAIGIDLANVKLDRAAIENLASLEVPIFVASDELAIEHPIHAARAPLTGSVYLGNVVSGDRRLPSLATRMVEATLAKFPDLRPSDLTAFGLASRHVEPIEGDVFGPDVHIRVEGESLHVNPAVLHMLRTKRTIRAQGVDELSGQGDLLRNQIVLIGSSAGKAVMLNATGEPVSRLYRDALAIHTYLEPIYAFQPLVSLVLVLAASGVIWLSVVLLRWMTLTSDRQLHLSTFSLVLTTAVGLLVLSSGFALARWASILWIAVFISSLLIFTHPQLQRLTIAAIQFIWQQFRRGSESAKLESRKRLE